MWRHSELKSIETNHYYEYDANPAGKLKHACSQPHHAGRLPELPRRPARTKPSNDTGTREWSGNHAGLDDSRCSADAASVTGCLLFILSICCSLNIDCEWKSNITATTSTIAEFYELDHAKSTVVRNRHTATVRSAESHPSLSVPAQHHVEPSVGLCHVDEWQRAFWQWQCLVVWHPNELLILTVTWRFNTDHLVFPNKSATDANQPLANEQLISV